MFDRILTGLTIMDGLGSEPFQGDIGIRDGHIAAVGSLGDAECKDRLDAQGKVVMPGIIDIHTHYDLCLGWDGLGAHCAKQGVTTVIGGNCGIGPEDVGAHLDAAEKLKLGLRYGILASHGPIRSRVVPRVEGRAASKDETLLIYREVERALEQGALGLSWGPYHSNSLADEAELLSVTKAAKNAGKPFVVHRRCEGKDGLEATREAFRLAEQTGVRVHISHLKIAGRKHWQKFEELMTLMESGARRLDLGFDVYPYEGSLTYLAAMIPSIYKSDGRLLERLADPAERAAIIHGIHGWFADRQGPDDILVFARHIEERSGSGAQNLASLAEEMGVQDPAECAAQIIERDPEGNGGWAAYRYMMNESHVQELCGRSDAIIASDAVPEVDGMAEDTHPRAYGTFARVLSQASKKSLPEFSQAVKKMTSSAANRYGLQKLGRIEKGCQADLVILDLNELQDCARYEEPSVYPKGIDSVFLGGEFVFKDGQGLTTIQGQVLRG
ncbi:MAG: amidohydrolase family protein [Planctomycetota bacterium]|nr:amidohydrolase family protein [Planctomycetota bacterium]